MKYPPDRKEFSSQVYFWFTEIILISPSSFCETWQENSFLSGGYPIDQFFELRYRYSDLALKSSFDGAYIDRLIHQNIFINWRFTFFKIGLLMNWLLFYHANLSINVNFVYLNQIKVQRSIHFINLARHSYYSLIDAWSSIMVKSSKILCDLNGFNYRVNI